MVESTEVGTEVLGLSIQDLVAYFYANDGLVASTQPERLQRLFGVFSGLFLLGWPQDEYTKDGEHGLSSMIHAWQYVGVGV